MEKKQLLLISENSKLVADFENEAGHLYELTSVKSIHAGYTIALSHLPDVILVDSTSIGNSNIKSIRNFRSTHFLAKCFLFLLADKKDKKIIEKEIKDQVDQVIYKPISPSVLLDEVEQNIRTRRSLSNYWRDSFMGLFNLMQNPVILLQNLKVVAMNDAFKRDFFAESSNKISLSDLVVDRNQAKVKETLTRFIRSKHMKASTRTVLMVNEKLREAKITFSKLDRSLCGQLVLLIDFTGKEYPLSQNIGSTSIETGKCFSNEIEEQSFTKREKEVIALLCKGYKTKEISEALCISAKTTEKHRANIVKRTNSGTILESVVYALNNNLIEI